MANFFIGSEVKFSITPTAIGFNPDTDDFDVTVATTRERFTASKDAPSADGKLRIFREPALSDIDLSESSDSSEDTGQWYGIYDSADTTRGDVKVIVTMHIPDSNAADGIRNEIAVAALGTGQNP